MKSTVPSTLHVYLVIISLETSHLALFTNGIVIYYLASLPELIAQTGLSQQATQRLREELSKFSMWLSKHSERYFSAKYDSPSKEYIDKAKGVNSQDVPGTVTARLFEMDKQEKSD